MNKQNKNRVLKELLSDYVRLLTDDVFNNESKEFYYEQALDILKRLKELNINQ